MKKIFRHILVLCLILLQTGCNLTITEKPIADTLIVVPIHFSGDITTTETPLDTRAPSSNDLYGIQVYQNGEKYAYGLFSNPASASIYLHTDKTYKFVCTLIKNGRNTIRYVQNADASAYAFKTFDYDPYHSSSQPLDYEMMPIATAVFGHGYSFPFVRSLEEADQFSYTLKYTNNGTLKTNLVIKDYESAASSWNPNYMKIYGCWAQAITNGFEYSATVGLDFLSESITVTQESINDAYPGIERYYGEYDNFSPTQEEALTIDMKSASFLLQYIVSGITDGTVHLSIKNDQKTFVDADISSSVTSDTASYSFNNIKEAWQYNDYTENLTVSMKWMRGVGIEQDLGSQMIQVKRGAVNVVEIALDTN
jgi:hypothetical protein